MLLFFRKEVLCSIEKLWAALITPARIANWLQADAVVEPWVGGRYGLAFRNSAHRIEVEITRFEPLAVLEFTWPEIKVNGDSLVLWELSPVDAGCRVVLTYTLTGGGDAVDFASGWHWHLDALGPAADGVATPWQEAQWRPLQSEYRGRFMTAAQA